MNRHERSLELDKILERLAAQTSCDDAADAARGLRPATDLITVQRLLHETEDAHMLMARFGAPSFGQPRNVNGALARANAGASLSMRELLDVAYTLSVIRRVTEWRSHCEGVLTCLDDRFSLLNPNVYLETKIITAIVSEEEMSDKASPLLEDIRRKMRSTSQRLRDQLDKMIRSPAYQKLLQDPIVTMRDGRYVVPVKAEHRGEVAGLVHDTSSSGATVFIEPMSVVEANNELRLLAAKEREEIDRILAALSAEAGSFSETITEDYRILIELNVIFAKARLAYEMKAEVPRVTDDGCLRLNQARHPLIDPQQVVPIDVELGFSFDCLVITGPNTGGKTVTLKTVGLLTLMAMCGLMIPVGRDSTVSVFTRVLVDIGDEQSIEQSLSTFSAHMTNLIGILEQADEHSLVLSDELGAGTDPVEGAALAMAILEQLRKQGARIVSTTHYAELKSYAIHTDGVQNGSCEFDVATLRPTYRLLIGIPGRSNAFAISERLGMPSGIVERAGSLVSRDNQQLESVIEQLNTQRQMLEEEQQKAKDIYAAAELAKRKAEQTVQEAKNRRDKEIDRAREQARRIVEQARTQAEQFMGELDVLRKQTKDIAALADAKSKLKAQIRAMDDTVDPVREQQQDTYVLPRPLKVGDTVRLADIDKTAVVLALPDKNGNVEVQAGIIQTRVPLSNLRLEKAPKPAKNDLRRPGSAGVSRSVRTAKTEVDLRGLNADEALLEVDRFIDASVMAGLGQVTVIHGKGTGVLRTEIHKHLRTHPSVAEFRLGMYGEGETGVTVITLK